MKASELIKILEAMIEEYGDCKVIDDYLEEYAEELTYDDGGFFVIRFSD